jgi:HD-like signal output (HDOD) protein
MTEPIKGTSTQGLRVRALAFEGLSDQEVGALYNLAAIKKISQGDYLIKEGDTDQNAFIILDGEFGVMKRIEGVDEEITVLGPGEWVGEIAFTKRIKRTASAVAKTPASVMNIDQSTLDALDHKTQIYFYRRLNDLATERIHMLSARESELTGKNEQLIDYILAIKSRGQLGYQESEMIRSIISKVPRPAGFVARLAARAADPKASNSEVTRIIKEDPEMVDIVLKAVNSPAYGFGREVQDIHQAFIDVGLNKVWLLLVAEGIRASMPDTQYFRELLDHCQCMGHLCFVVSQESQTGRPPLASMIGLVHGLGLNVIQLLKEKNPTLAILLDALDPAHIGSALLTEWKLPQIICKAVEHEHYPEFSPPSMVPEEVRSYVTVLYFSHLLLDTLTGQSQADKPHPFVREYVKYLGWGDQDLADILDIRLWPVLDRKSAKYPAALRDIMQKFREKREARAKLQPAIGK